MKTNSIYSQFGGYEFLLVRKPGLLSDVFSTVGAMIPAEFTNDIHIEIGKNRQHETKTKPVDKFSQDGWKTLHAPQETPTQLNLSVLIKDRVALFVKTGGTNESSFTCREMCHALYVRDEIDVGIEILPMKSLQAEMSSGPGYYEGELYNVIRNGRGVPSVPLVMIGIAP